MYSIIPSYFKVFLAICPVCVVVCEYDNIKGETPFLPSHITWEVIGKEGDLDVLRSFFFLEDFDAVVVERITDFDIANSGSGREVVCSVGDDSILLECVCSELSDDRCGETIGVVCSGSSSCCRRGFWVSGSVPD